MLGDFVVVAEIGERMHLKALFYSSLSLLSLDPRLLASHVLTGP